MPRTHSVAAALALLLTTACADSTSPAAPASALAKKASNPAAQGGKPTREYIPDERLFFTNPPGAGCAFGVSGEPVVNRLADLTFPTDEDGETRIITTGTLVMRFTNVATGKSVTEQISGPAHVTVHADGSATIVATGRWQIWGRDARTGAVVFTIHSGRVVLEIPTGGGIGTIVSSVGHAYDLCAALS